MLKNKIEKGINNFTVCVILSLSKSLPSILSSCIKARISWTHEHRSFSWCNLLTVNSFHPTCFYPYEINTPLLICLSQSKDSCQTIDSCRCHHHVNRHHTTMGNIYLIFHIYDTWNTYHSAIMTFSTLKRKFIYVGVS